MHKNYLFAVFKYPVTCPRRYQDGELPFYLSGYVDCVGLVTRMEARFVCWAEHRLYQKRVLRQMNGYIIANVRWIRGNININSLDFHSRQDAALAFREQCHKCRKLFMRKYPNIL